MKTTQAQAAAVLTSMLRDLFYGRNEARRPRDKAHWRRELRSIIVAIRALHDASPDAHRDYHRKLALKVRVEETDKKVARLKSMGYA